jgi:hypothetical protein
MQDIDEMRNAGFMSAVK